jgi:hypothetical protein
MFHDLSIPRSLLNDNDKKDDELPMGMGAWVNGKLSGRNKGIE